MKRFLFLSGFIAFFLFQTEGTELTLFSHTSLSPSVWSQEVEAGLIFEPWSIRAGVRFASAEPIRGMLGLRYDAERFAVWGEETLSQGASPLISLGGEVRPADFLSLGVEVGLEGGTFTGANVLFSFGVPGVGGGGARFTGIVEMGAAAAVVGQTLCLGISLFPMDLQIALRFDDGGFSSLELFPQVTLEGLAVGGSLGWDPSGLCSVGGEFSFLEEALSLSVRGLFSPGQGSWRVSGEIASDYGLRLGAEYSRFMDFSSWNIAAEFSLESFTLAFSMDNQGGAFTYSGRFSWNFSYGLFDLTGRVAPSGGWELNVGVRLSWAMN